MDNFWYDYIINGFRSHRQIEKIRDIEKRIQDYFKVGYIDPERYFLERIPVFLFSVRIEEEESRWYKLKRVCFGIRPKGRTLLKIVVPAECRTAEETKEYT